MALVTSTWAQDTPNNKDTSIIQRKSRQLRTQKAVVENRLTSSVENMVTRSPTGKGLSPYHYTLVTASFAVREVLLLWGFSGLGH